MPDDTFDVFISYSHRDIDWVRDWLLPRLESANLRVCIDYRDFAIGVPSLVNMENAVERSRKTLMVLTPNWVQSEWTNFESLLIQTKDPIGTRRRLLPLLREKCDLPARLEIFTYADFTDSQNWDSELGRVVKAINSDTQIAFPSQISNAATSAPRVPVSVSPQSTTGGVSISGGDVTAGRDIVGGDKIEIHAGNVYLTPSTPPTSNHPIIQPNLVHPYALQANFTGRVQERAELTAWLADDAHPICALVAMGGMGKSALAWFWLTQDILKSEIKNRKLDGVMWWSFYEGEASFAKFVDEALKYVTGRDFDATRLPTTYDRAQELRRELQSKRVLFVLDGFERQLRAYARLDAAYQRDDATESSREARACVEPNAGRLLRDLTAGTTHAKVLITSRLMVSDLEDRAGDPLAGVLHRELKELARDDAIAFMHAQCVTKGTPGEIATACEAYGNHPLSLRLLSGLIARDTRTPGDIAAAPRHDVHDDLIARQHHILQVSYDALPENERTLLSRIAAFRSAMTYDALAIFNEFGDEAKFDAALNNLRDWGLLQRDTTRNRYDLHPIVRRYAYDRLTDKEGVHTRLINYFEKTPTPNTDKVKSIEDLSPVIELYHHTVCAGRYDEAVQLFRDRLNQFLYYHFGAYQLRIELLYTLFADGEDHPPRLTDKVWQGWVVNELVNAYGKIGQSRRAILFSEQQHVLEKARGLDNPAIVLSNLAHRHIEVGELAMAEQNMRRAVDLYRGTEYHGNKAVRHHQLGKLLSLQGDFSEATSKFNFAMMYYKSQENIQPSLSKEWQGKLLADLAYRALLMNQDQSALTTAQQARKLADVKRFERDIILSEWLLGWAFVMEGKDLNAADTHLTEALTRCRRINLVELEPDILLAWARWHRACGNTQEAQAHAEEALAIADRCEYRLKQADIHNFLARLALDAGNRAAARKEAEIAKARAWCDGPPHCYKPALDEAEKMLERMKAEG